MQYVFVVFTNIAKYLAQMILYEGKHCEEFLY